jgi:hypothetical protein
MLHYCLLLRYLFCPKENAWVVLRFEPTTSRAAWELTDALYRSTTLPPFYKLIYITPFYINNTSYRQNMRTTDAFATYASALVLVPGTVSLISQG